MAIELVARLVAVRVQLDDTPYCMFCGRRSAVTFSLLAEREGNPKVACFCAAHAEEWFGALLDELAHKFAANA